MCHYAPWAAATGSPLSHARSALVVFYVTVFTARWHSLYRLEYHTASCNQTSTSTSTDSYWPASSGQRHVHADRSHSQQFLTELPRDTIVNAERPRPWVQSTDDRTALVPPQESSAGRVSKHWRWVVASGVRCSTRLKSAAVAVDKIGSLGHDRDPCKHCTRRHVREGNVGCCQNVNWPAQRRPWTSSVYSCVDIYHKSSSR